MKTEQITEYVAKDGKRFRSGHAAEKHEEELDAVSLVILPRGSPPSGKYIQHNPITLRQAKRDLFALILAKHGQQFPEWRKFDADEVHPRSIVGRVLDDSDGPLTDAWNGLSVYDFETGREYEQPYFVDHPEETTPV